MQGMFDGLSLAQSFWCCARLPGAIELLILVVLYRQSRPKNKLDKLVSFTMEVKSYEVTQRYASTGVENRGIIAFEFPIRRVL